MRLSQFKNTDERRQYLEDKLNVKLDWLNKVLIDEEATIHAENLIGAIALPLGIAGPLEINGGHTRGDFYIPLATTEGALIASVNRGSKAITLSGGVNVRVNRVGVTRAPVFYTGSLENGRRLENWVEKNQKMIAKEAKKTSSHLKLMKLETKTLANYSYIRFYFDTQDAMGMNMATIATEKIVELIEKKTEIKCLSLAGNFDIDKKPAWLNFIQGRGFNVVGEAILPDKITRGVLKTTSQKIFDTWLAKCMLGSAVSGSLGFNCHFANIVAAFFAATGQDLAHVVEGSMGVTVLKVLPNNDLYFSIYMPAVILGTVGGGNNLKTQTETKKIIGVKKSEELAEVLAGAVLAGELSLLASLSEGTLAQAHQKLGR